MSLADWKLRLRALFFRRSAERDLADEVDFHLALEARKYREQGMDSKAARLRARAEFGGVTQTMEQCRDRRGLRALETLAQDVRYALRGFRKTPGFAITVVATIALSLGLNTALFTLFNGYFLQPLAVTDPYTLFTWSNPGGGDHHLMLDEFRDFQRDNPAFAQTIGSHFFVSHGEGHQLLGSLVSADYFSMLGVETASGRTLIPDDGAAIVLSAAAWKNKFGGDPGILGRRISVRGVVLEVVGVARPGFSGLAGVPQDFWAPLAMAPRLLDTELRLRISGRLRPGWSVPRTEAALTAWMRHRATDATAARSLRAVLHSQATSLPLDPIILAAFSPVVATFGLVMLIACANVANMMLARAMARQREIGIRLAMGAGRARLIRQLLTECVLLALPAAAAGFALSQASIEWGTRLVIATVPRSFADFITLPPQHPDARVFGFMLLAAVLSAALFGLAPALQVTRVSALQATRGECSTSLRPGRLRHILVIGQVTVSVLFLICASILLRTNHRFETLDTGMDTRGVLAIETRDAQRSRLLAQLAGSPEVAGMAAASKMPFNGILPPALVQPAGERDLWWIGYFYASPEYFDFFRVPLLRGRRFTTAEAAANAPVAVISENTARLLWPRGDALGQTFRITLPAGRRAPLGQEHAGLPPFATAQVIGIARDAANGWLGNGQKDSSCIYFPRAPGASGNVIFVRAKGRLEAALDRALPGAVSQIHSMDEIFALQSYPWRALYWVAAGIGALALLLTLSGIYGVMSYLVTQRTREIGIRLALGASAAGVSRLVLGQSLRMAAIGTAFGIAGAIGMIQLVAATGAVGSVGGFDPVAGAMGAAVVLAAAGCAAWIPSRRAAGVEPVSALRWD